MSAAKHAGWPAGIDNLSPEQALRADEHGVSVALRAAENVDLIGTGLPRRRDGYAAAMWSSSGVHSLWSCTDAPFGLVVKAGELCLLRDAASPEVLRHLAAPQAAVSYALVGDRVFWSNGTDRGVVTANGDDARWGCPMPAGLPTLAAAAASGGLAAGRYQVSITYVLASGEESGAPLAGWVDLAAGDGLALSAIPQPPVGVGVSEIRVYVSTPNGDVLHRAKSLLVGITDTTIGVHRPGRVLDTHGFVALPAGRFVRAHAGRLWVLSASAELMCSEPLRFGLMDPRNSIQLSGMPCMLESVGTGTEGAGLFVATGKRTYFLAGTAEHMTPAVVYPHGVVTGTAIRVPGSALGLETTATVAYWLADNGVGVVGLPGGTVQPLREQQAVAPAATSGASMYRESNGARQIVTTLAETSERGFAMRDSATSTITRHNP